MDTGIATVIAAGIAAITSIAATILAWRSLIVTKVGIEKN